MGVQGNKKWRSRVLRQKRLIYKPSGNRRLFRGLRGSEGVLLGCSEFVVDVKSNDIFIEGAGLEIFDIEKMVGLWSLRDRKSLIKSFDKADRSSGWAFGGKRNKNLSVGDGGDKWSSEDVAGFDARFLRSTKVFNYGGNNGNGGKNNNQRNDNGKGGF